MNFQRVICTGIVGFALAVWQPLHAFQAEDTTKATTKKAKKKAKDATDIASPVADTTKETKKRTKNVTGTTGKASRDATETDDKAATASTATTKRTPGKTKAATSAPAKTVSDSEISAAKASGKVWVNTDTGVYHTDGQWYGATKQGKFMNEQDAITAGYRKSKTK